MSRNLFKKISYHKFELAYYDSEGLTFLAFNQPLVDMLQEAFIPAEYKPSGEWVLPWEREVLLRAALVYVASAKTKNEMRDYILEKGEEDTNGLFYRVIKRGKFELLLMGISKMVEKELDSHLERYKNVAIF